MPIEAITPDNEETSNGSTTYNKKPADRSRNKVLILGDSHARNCSQGVKHNLNRTAAVQGIIKPGANMETIVGTSIKSVEKFTKKDTIVVWGGTRDVGRSKQISNGFRLYISKYQSMYKHLVKAKKMYNEAFIWSSKNTTKGIWQVINKETGIFSHNNYNIHLQYNNEAITDPQLISERFNKCFIDTINDLLNKGGHNLTRVYQQGIKTNSASMFVSPITATN